MMLIAGEDAKLAATGVRCVGIACIFSRYEKEVIVSGAASYCEPN